MISSTSKEVRLLSGGRVCLAFFAVGLALGQFAYAEGRVGGREALFQKLVSGRASAAEKRGVLTRGRAAVQRVVARPNRVSETDRAAIGLLSPVERARALNAYAGFKLEDVSFAEFGGKARLAKVRLIVPKGDGNYRVFTETMSPNLLTMIPGRGHTYSMWQGKVMDLWENSATAALRYSSSPRPMLPIWLSDGEAGRFELMAGQVKRFGFEKVMGEKLSHGRPEAWPLREMGEWLTENSCTTGYHRAPVGPRRAEFAWVDGLQKQMQSRPAAQRLLQGKTILEASTNRTQKAVKRLFAGLRRAAPDSASKQRLTELQGWVIQQRYHLVTPKFPMELLHRESLAELIGINNDSPGPSGLMKELRGTESPRIGLDIKFQK